MALTPTHAVLQQVRLEDGSMAVVLPINTTDEVMIDMVTKKSLTTHLSEVGSTIEANKDSVVEDMVTVMTTLSPFFKKPLLMNHIYADDFSEPTSVTVTKGIFVDGKIFI